MRDFFEKLSKQKGIIDGDLHVENVDFMISDKGKAFLGINDFDAIAEGQLSHDVVRLFGSAKTIYPEMKWKDFLESYLAGIGNKEDYVFGKIYKREIEKAKENAKKLMKNYVEKDKKGDPRFKKKKGVAYKMENSEEKALKDALEKKYKGIEIYDAYKRIKESGASAGKKRFQVLVKLKGSDDIRWMDVKIWDQGDYDKAINGGSDSLTPEQKLKAAKKKLYDGKLDDSLDRIVMEGENYSIKFVDQFASVVDFEKIREDYNDKAIVKFILDEAYMVGTTHRRSLRREEAKQYTNEWEKIDNDKMDSEILGIIKSMNEDFEMAKIGQGSL